MKRLALLLPVLILACVDGSDPTEVATFASDPAFVAVPEGGPAQYCKEAAPEEFFNACTVCAANGSDSPIGDTRICACKTIMAGFFGPPEYDSFGACMNDWK